MVRVGSMSCRLRIPPVVRWVTVTVAASMRIRTGGAEVVGADS
jgi:hypothetical protein